MPYLIGTEGSHGCDGFPVLVEGTERVVGCHPTKERARRHIRALYANVPDARVASVRVLAGAPAVRVITAAPLAAQPGCGCGGAHQAAALEPFDAPYPVAEYPPADWFEDPTDWLDKYFADNGLDDGIQWLAVTDEGRVGGYWWTEGVCHVDYTATMQAGSHECWMPEPSPSNYARFHQSEVITSTGAPLRVGVVGNIGGHVDPRIHHDPRVAASIASTRYADPSAQRLVVRAGDRPGRGGWIAGALVPGTTYGDVAMLRRSTMSGDWRWFHPDAMNPAGGYDALGPTIVTRPGLAHAPRVALVRVASADGHDAFYTEGSPRLAGDVAGHEFHGNQHTGGFGGGDRSSVDKWTVSSSNPQIQRELDRAVRDPNLIVAESRVRELIGTSDHPGLADLDHVNPELANEIADRIERLEQEVPNAGALIAAVSTTQLAPDTLAITVNGAQGQSSIILNELYYRNPDYMTKACEMMSDKGFHPRSDTAGVIDHEFGHVLNNAAIERGGAFMEPKLSEYWVDPMRGGAISGYGKDNAHEAVAETYAARVAGQEIPPRSEQFVAQMIHDATLQAAELTARWGAKAAAATVTAPHTCTGYVPQWVLDKIGPPPPIAKQAGDVAGHEFHGNQWTGGTGGGGEGRVDAAKVDDLKGGHAGTEDDPVPCGSDLDRAVQLIADDVHVTLDQPEQVSTLLDKLGAYSKMVAAKTGEKPNLNLCNVSVADTNLFCAEHQGVPRVEMPQLSGVPVPGSPADGFPKDDKGEVDLSEHFAIWLEVSHELEINEHDIDASHLRASQKELDGAKVAGMMRAEKYDPAAKAIFTTRDNYVIDGHHRWAATVGREIDTGSHIQMHVRELNIDIGTALFLSNQYVRDMGIPPKGLGAQSEGVKAASVIVRQIFGPLRVRLAGDVGGHEFRGNQWTGGMGGGEGSSDASKVPGDVVAALGPKEIDALNGAIGIPLASMSSLTPDLQAKVMANVTTKCGIDPPEQVEERFQAMFDAAVERGTTYDEGMTWYQDNHDAAQALCDQHGFDIENASAALAGMSPGTEWTTEMPILETMMSHENGAVQLSEEALAVVNAKLEGEGHAPISNGDKYAELDTRAAIFGMKAEHMESGPGGWAARYSLSQYETALGQLRGSPHAETLVGVKVREFYNNLANPNASGHVTIDVMMMRAATANPKFENGSNITGAPSKSVTTTREDGTKVTLKTDIGPTPYMADAVRNIADRAGIMPQQAQAIIWSEWKAQTGR